MKLIALTQGKFAKVDDKDFDFLNQFKWCARGQGKYWYAYRNAGAKEPMQAMHRFILNVTERKLQVDHINHDGLDNQRCNIRIVTPSQNQMNKLPKPKTSSQYKGVTWCKDKNKWGVWIRINGKSTFFGRFNSELEAAKIYDKTARQHFGQFALCNFTE